MASWLVIIAVLAFLYFVVPKIIIWMTLRSEPEWKKKLPGPYPTSFIAGSLQVVGEFNSVPGRPMAHFDRLHEKYGDFILIRGGLIAPDILMMSNPDYAIDSLASHYKGATYNAVRIINNNDLLLSDGAYWHRQRKLMNPMFSMTAIKGMYHLMVDELKQLTEYLNRQDASKSININEVLQKVALDVLTSAAFGVNYGALYGANTDAIEAMSGLLHEVELRSTDPLGHRLNPFASWRLANLRKRVRSLARKCLEDRKNDPAALKSKKDLLNMMLQAEDPDTGKKMSEEEIISENVIFLVAGHETTAHSMTWFLYHTAKNPQWITNVQNEVDEILKGKDFPEYDDLSRMTVLDMAIKESMRMTPVTPGGSLREVTEDVQLGEYVIGKGTAIMVPIHLLNMDKRFWKNPETFDPERFANNQSHYPNFMPFSSGPRNCIGQTFAKVEMRAVMSTVAKYYNWKLDPAKPVEAMWAVTQKPKSGMFIFLSKRQK
jgi:cytochrome P450